MTRKGNYIKQIVNENVNKLLNETSRRQKAQQAIYGLNRKVKTLAIISTENPMSKVISKEENEKQREKLLYNLKVGHYLYFETRGKYNTLENSVIVYNISLEETLDLCHRYNQQRVIFVDMTDEEGQVSYQYWERTEEDLELKLTHEEHRIVNATNDDDFYTKISKHFKFRIPFFEHVESINNLLSEKAKKYDVDNLIGESLNQSRTGYSRYMIRGKLYGKD